MDNLGNRYNESSYNKFLRVDPYDDSDNNFFELGLLTPGRKEIKNKEEYIDSTLLQLKTEKSGEEIVIKTKIKGRGNSTWESAPKKPYSLKLYKKESLGGYPADKSWVLLANYFDPTHLRNSIASFMGRRISNLEFSSHFSFVDLTLNEEFQGIYQIGEKIEIGENRVNVGGDGFLLEIDGKAKDTEPTFKALHLISEVNIKEPDILIGDDNYNWIKDYVLKAEETLYSDNFIEEEGGYDEYFDIESFVDWYLINEIAKNADACMFTSCFMNIQRGGKLKMGPIWDFDLAFGNYIFQYPHTEIINSPTGFWVKDAPWYERFFLDPEFYNMVKNRFMLYYDNRDSIYNYIDTKAAIVSKHINMDNAIWGRINPNETNDDKIIKLYFQKIADLKQWIEDRFQWMYMAFNQNN